MYFYWTSQDRQETTPLTVSLAPPFGLAEDPEPDPSSVRFGLFKTCHRTRSSVAIESSTEECPSNAPPVWIDCPRCSFTRSFNARRYGRPALCGNNIAVSTHRWWIIRSVLRSLSKACPTRTVSELMKASKDFRMDVNAGESR